MNAFAFDISTGEMFDMNTFATRGLDPDAILRLTDINNQGQFVGTVMINGFEHGIIGNIGAIPEPSALTSAAIGVVVVLIFARARMPSLNLVALKEKFVNFLKRRNHSEQERLSSTILPPSPNSCENAMRM